MLRDKEALLLSRQGIEVWREVPGYGGLYSVSNMGRVESLTRQVISHRNHSGFKQVNGRILSPGKSTKAGHVSVGLVNVSGQQKTWHVHQLVMLAFCGPRPHDKETRHLNGSAADNRLCNIKYGSCSENTLDRVRHGRGIGERHGCAVLTTNEVVAIKTALLKPYLGIGKALAEKYGCSASIISSIRKGNSWRHV